jgi:uncharacterized membrane protein
MARACPSCGAQLDEVSVFCGACGKPVAPSATGGAPAASPTTPGQVGGLTENVAGMLAYITFIPAIIFLLIEPFNRNRFVRFHSFQCIFLAVFWIALNVVLAFIPFLGWALSGPVGLVGVVIWLLLLFKAYQGEKFKLPVIGDMAEKQAAAI